MSGKKIDDAFLHVHPHSMDYSKPYSLLLLGHKNEGNIRYMNGFFKYIIRPRKSTTTA
jgi:hypothetical protein